MLIPEYNSGPDYEGFTVATIGYITAQFECVLATDDVVDLCVTLCCATCVLDL